jgi:hypothetical protein
MRHQIRLALIATAVAVSISSSGGGAFAQSFGATICTQEYAPVCAVRHGHAKIYPSRCVANSTGARVVSKSRCSRRPVSVRG